MDIIERINYEINNHLLDRGDVVLIESKNEIQALRQQLAVKDLEVMQLREGLIMVALSIQSYRRILNDTQPCGPLMLADKLLSTTFTPDNLMAWLGEPVAWIWNDEPSNDTVISTLEQIKPATSTPLYAPKLEIK